MALGAYDEARHPLNSFAEIAFDFGAGAINAIVHMSSMRERLPHPSGVL
jgi:hypothetical protein